MRLLVTICVSICFYSCKNQSRESSTTIIKIPDTTAIHKEVKETFTSFDGTEIYFKDEGTGKPVILIHGFISSGSSWYETALVDSLKNKGYRVIIPDMRGNGKSDKPQNPEAYQNDAEVKDLKALATYLKLDKFEVVGYSRGSIVLAKWLTDEPRISKAVIGGMGLDFSNPEWNRRIAFADAFSGREPLTEMTEGAVKYATSIDADLKVLGYLQDYQPITSIEALKTITIRVLVLAGDQDKDNGEHHALQAALGFASLKIIPGDHNTTYRKAPFAREVIKFLNRD